MNRSIAAIRRLREVAAMLGERPDSGGEAGAWFAGALLEYQADAHRGTRLDEALGLVPEPGRRAWFTVEAAERRDDLLRRQAADGASARTIAAELARYEATAWPRERAFAAAPPRYQGSRREILFRVLRTNGTAPGWRTVARALCHERPDIPVTMTTLRSTRR